MIRGAGGERTVGMDDFHVGPYMTAVGDGEMLTEIRLPVRAGAGSAHEKVERRAGDLAIAAASAAVWIDGGTIADAGIALSAVGPTTIDVTRAEELLRGKTPSDELFAQAGEIAVGGLLADRRRPRTGRLQAPPRRRAHQARAAPRHRARPATGGLNMQRHDHASTASRSRATSSRARCSCTSSATRPA